MKKELNATALMGFIDKPQQEEQPQGKDLHNLHKLHKLHKPQTEVKEHKGNGREPALTTRLNLMLSPSEMEDLKALAQMEYLGLSEIVRNLIDKAIEENRSRIDRHKKAMSKPAEN